MAQPIEFVIRTGRPDTIDTLREYASHRLSLALRRFENRIRQVTVRISDLNGPRRGVDSAAAHVEQLEEQRRRALQLLSATGSKMIDADQKGPRGDDQSPRGQCER